MRKDYLNVQAQLELLSSRGLACDDRSAKVLMREGYYAVINGYGKPFLDSAASREAGEDRYMPGTTLDQVYALFCFDRALRMLTFGELMRVEGLLRAIVAESFLQSHPGPEDYLDERCFTTSQSYILGEDNYRRNLRQLLETLSRCAHGHERDERERDDARLAHYREHYDSVPLWVVFSDFSYGNLYYFLALMKREDQLCACKRLARALEDERPRPELTRRALIEDVNLQVEVRNYCAHGERLYDACLGKHDDRGYAQFACMLPRFLSAEDGAAYTSNVLALLNGYTGICPIIDRELDRTQIRSALATVSA